MKGNILKQITLRNENKENTIKRGGNTLNRGGNIINRGVNIFMNTDRNIVIGDRNTYE